MPADSGKRKKPGGPWLEDGPPRSIVLYRTSDGWRFSIGTEKGGILCGRYSELPISASFDEARAVAGRTVHELGRNFFGLNLAVEWEPADSTEWWNGTVVHH